jgi:hypothetical protein
MTDQEIIDLWYEKGYSAFDTHKKCARCGFVWYRHERINCYDYTTGKSLGTTFMPTGSISWDNVGDKKSRIAPSKKVYKEECPCGLHPSQCEYHK